MHPAAVSASAATVTVPSMRLTNCDMTVFLCQPPGDRDLQANADLLDVVCRLRSREWSGYRGGMGLLGDLIKTAADVMTNGRRQSGTHGNPARKRARSSRADAEVLPGESGPDATVEVDPHRIGPVRMSYSPQTDGAPDPGEVVWTWVPFEEHDGRGKDRPVLVVAVEPAGTYLAVQLTSKDHDGQGDFVSVGAGGWDGEHRPSWVNLDRVIRVHEGGMRREAAALPREPFERVTGRLQQRYGWR